MAKKNTTKAVSEKALEPELYSDSDKDFFKKLILDRREKLLEELKRLHDATRSTVREYSGDHSTYSLHMADQGTDAQEREKAFLLASREGRYLKYLDRALSMIEDGTYGYCSSCGESIHKRRLELVPTSRLCVACKVNEEKLHPK
ncbi:TraR/DksA family transcriptional regulator [Calditrichota bacterium]